MNTPEREALRIQLVQESHAAEHDYEQVAERAQEYRVGHRPGGGLRPLDQRSRRELRRMIAWCLEQEDWHFRPNELFRGPVAGFGYTEGPGLLGRLEAGDKLCLAREPDNPHDPTAVRVDWNGHRIGYVPRSDNRNVARRLDAGATLDATILAVQPEAEPWTQLEIAIGPAPA